MFGMLNQMADWAFDKSNDEMQELDYAAQSNLHYDTHVSFFKSKTLDRAGAKTYNDSK